MDPVEQFRLLRDDSRWVEEELDFDAYAQPMRRRWSWPRIAGFSAAGVAVAVAAVLVAVGVHGSWNAAPVPAAPSPKASDSLPGVVPDCRLDQLEFAVTPYEPQHKWDLLIRAGWFTGKNISDTTCRIVAHQGGIGLAQSASTQVGGGVTAFEDEPGPADVEVQPGRGFVIPFAEYAFSVPTASCHNEAAGLTLMMPIWTSRAFVAARTVYCDQAPATVSWPAASTMYPGVLEDDLVSLSSTTPTPPPSSSAEAPSGAQCTSDELSAALSPSRSSDQATDWAIIDVKNTGARSCEIGPWASLGWIFGPGDGNYGYVVPTGDTGNGPVVLAPGDSAGVIIGFTQSAKQDPNCTLRDGAWLRLELGSAGTSTARATLDVDVSARGIQGCAGSAKQLKVFSPKVGASLHE